MQRIAILYTPAGAGHRVAAHAIAAELASWPGTAVEVRDVLDFAPRWFVYDRAWGLNGGRSSAVHRLELATRTLV
jgi:hypothetical protein